MKIAIYTAIFGGKDRLQEPLNYNENSNIDWYCFTDNDNLISPIYKICKTPQEYSDITKNARKLKVLGFQGNEIYDYVIWHDANLRLDASKIDLLIKSLNNNQYLVFKHPKRNCAYKEALACIDLQKDYPLRILLTTLILFINRLKNHAGLYETGIFVRRNKTKNKKFEEYWWNLIYRYSRRDQITLPLSMKKYNVQIKTMAQSIETSDYCIMQPHNYLHYNDQKSFFFVENRLSKSFSYHLIKVIIRLNNIFNKK